MDHESNQPASAEEDAGAKQRTRYGLVLFSVYVVIYSGFVLLNTFAPDRMEATPIFGVNLAVLYGMLLIIAALVLALIYGWLCRSR